MNEELPAERPRALSDAEARAASRQWWDAEADHYQEEHGSFLGDVDFMWCPEGLRESDARLLGEVRGKRVLEIGCGAAAAARWLNGQGAHVTASDLSSGMLRQARLGAERSRVQVPLVQADALALPFADGSFDTAYTAFGAVPFLADTAALMQEVFRVLRSGGSWVFSAYHPFRWIFPDAPDESGLRATYSYFDRRPYVERNADGDVTYLQQHRTMGDRVRELVAAGFVLTDLIEPEWPEGQEQVWGEWSPLRGRIFPGTAIYVTRRP